MQFDVTEGRRSAEASSLYAAANDTSYMAGRIADLARRSEMGAHGRKRIETELSWDHQVATLIAAYERVTET